MSFSMPVQNVVVNGISDVPLIVFFSLILNLKSPNGEKSTNTNTNNYDNADRPQTNLAYT